MNVLRIFATATLLLCVNIVPVRSSAPSSGVMVSEGGYIGYATVADALATLKAQGLAPEPAGDDISFVESDGKTSWTFAGRENPAYPAVARIIYSKSSESVQRIEITVLCEAAEGPCAKFRSDIRNNVEQLSKMMAGDTSIRCRTDGHTMKCGAAPERKQTSQQIFVQIEDGGTCIVDNVVAPCLDVGKQIRAQHPSDDPKIAVCASAKIKYDAVGSVLGALNEQDLPIMFGCPPR
jgi:hypothetical protein